MKSIIYILLFAMLAGLVFSAIPVSVSRQSQTITLQSLEKVAPELMYNSADVITKRLKDAGIQHVEVSVRSTEGILTVTFNGPADVNGILPLLTGKGHIGFYETVNRTEVIKLLQTGNPLFSTMKIPLENSVAGISADVLGWCVPDQMAAVNNLLTELPVAKDSGIRFCWSVKPENTGEFRLHTLKSTTILDQSYLSEVSIAGDQPNAELLLSFNPQGALVWQNLSKNNIGHPVAIVIDDRVYADPVVRDEIKNGKCVITGNFRMDELKVLKALISNGEMPVALRVVK